MPFAAKKRRVSSGYSVLTRTPVRQVLDALDRRVTGDRDDHPDRQRRGLRVVQLAEADDVARRLLDPVAAGDADVEQSLGDVGRDLLRAQDAHLGDPRVVDAWPCSRPTTSGRPAGRPPRTARASPSRANPWAAPVAARRRGYRARADAHRSARHVRRVSGGRRRRAGAARAAARRGSAPSCSTQPFGEPGVLQMIACPRMPATPRDRRPSGLTSRIASARPGASRSITARVPSGV